MNTEIDPLVTEVLITILQTKGVQQIITESGSRLEVIRK